MIILSKREGNVNHSRNVKLAGSACWRDSSRCTRSVL